MYFTKKEIGGGLEFISRPNLFGTKTVEVPQSMGKDVDGKKIVKAGTIFPANDGTAKGFVVNDVDVTTGPQPGAILDHGYVYEERLPEAPAAEAKTALEKHIIFE